VPAVACTEQASSKKARHIHNGWSKGSAWESSRRQCLEHAQMILEQTPADADQMRPPPTTSQTCICFLAWISAGPKMAPPSCLNRRRSQGNNEVREIMDSICTRRHPIPNVRCAFKISLETMGWLRIVGSLKLQVSFGKEPYTRDYILQKRPIMLRSLLLVATP